MLTIFVYFYWFTKAEANPDFPLLSTSKFAFIIRSVLPKAIPSLNVERMQQAVGPTWFPRNISVLFEERYRDDSHAMICLSFCLYTCLFHSFISLLPKLNE